MSRQPHDSERGRRLRRVAAVASALAFAVIVTAPSGAPVGAATPKRTLRQMLLTVQNMPTGWSVHTGTAKSPPSYCGRSNFGFKGERRVTTQFVASGGLPSFDEELIAGSGVNSEYNRITRVLSQCSSVTITSSGHTYNGSVGSMSFPSLGARSAAFTVTITSPDLVLDQVFVRQGQLLAVFQEVGLLQVDPTQLQQLTLKGLQKLGYHGHPTSAQSPPASAPPATLPTTTTTAPSGPVQLNLDQPAPITQNGANAATVTVQSVNATTQPGNSFGEAPANGYFVIANISIASSVNGFEINPLDFYAVDKNGTHYREGNGNAFEALSDPSTELQASTLNAGENESGPIVFDMPVTHGEIVYAPNLNGAPLAEWSF